MKFTAASQTACRLQNFDTFSDSAEFLDDLLPAQIKPDFVLMNPPFSASGGRTSKARFKFRLSARRSGFAQASARRSSRRSARRRRLS
jgi:tRNA1(Val) A37 N6-methylase TrmN6